MSSLFARACLFGQLVFTFVLTLFCIFFARSQILRLRLLSDAFLCFPLFLLVIVPVVFHCFSWFFVYPRRQIGWTPAVRWNGAPRRQMEWSRRQME